MHGPKYKLNTMECGMNWVTFLIFDFYHSLTTKKLENSKNKHVEEMFKNCSQKQNMEKVKEIVQIFRLLLNFKSRYKPDFPCYGLL